MYLWRVVCQSQLLRAWFGLCFWFSGWISQKSSPQVSSLHQLHRALDGCQFDSFWQLAVAEPAKTLLATVPGVHTALRKCALDSNRIVPISSPVTTTLLLSCFEQSSRRFWPSRTAMYRWPACSPCSAWPALPMSTPSSPRLDGSASVRPSSPSSWQRVTPLTVIFPADQNAHMFMISAGRRGVGGAAGRGREPEQSQDGLRGALAGSRGGPPPQRLRQLTEPIYLYRYACCCRLKVLLNRG